MKAKVFHRVNTFNKTTEEIIIDTDKIMYISPWENNTLSYVTLDDGSYFVVEETLDFFKKLLVSE